MKLTEIKMPIKSIIVLAMMTFLFVSCSRKAAFLNSSVVPAAQGSVKVKKDNNKNYSIDLSVMRLADPGRLTPPREVYIVWMETEQNGVKSIGQLKTSSGLLSKTLKSSLKTVTPYKPTGFFITAEDNAVTHYPGAVEVLRTGSLN